MMHGPLKVKINLITLKITIDIKFTASSFEIIVIIGILHI